jgi:hypothetical protein
MLPDWITPSRLLLGGHSNAVAKRLSLVFDSLCGAQVCTLRKFQAGFAFGIQKTFSSTLLSRYPLTEFAKKQQASD